MIIAISGTPGTGKTEVAKKVAKKLGYEYLPLNDFAKDKKFLMGRDDDRNCDIVDIKKILKEIKKRKDENLVIESHYAHEIYFDALFILGCDSGILRKRLEKRGWSDEKIMENIESEIMEIIPEEARENKINFTEIINDGNIKKTVTTIVKSVKRI